MKLSPINIILATLCALLLMCSSYMAENIDPMEKIINQACIEVIDNHRGEINFAHNERDQEPIRDALYVSIHKGIIQTGLSDFSEELVEIICDKNIEQIREYDSEYNTNEIEKIYTFMIKENKLIELAKTDTVPLRDLIYVKLLKSALYKQLEAELISDKELNKELESAIPELIDMIMHDYADLEQLKKKLQAKH